MRIAAAFAAMICLTPVPAIAMETECSAPDWLVQSPAPLPQVAVAAREQHRLEILLLSGSPSQTSGKELRSYPSYFEAALAKRLPGVSVRVTVRSIAKRSVRDLLPALPDLLAETPPSLVIWQSGTVDAYRGVHVADFREALDAGITEISRAGADVVIVNPQYSPWTSAIVDTRSFAVSARWVAATRDVPLFSRYDIMRHWKDTDTFDLSSYRNEGQFEKVHGCLGELLADFVIGAAGLAGFRAEGPPPVVGQ